MNSDTYKKDRYILALLQRKVQGERYVMTGDEREAMRICTRQGESRGLAASAGAAAVGYALFRRSSRPILAINATVGAAFTTGALAASTSATPCVEKLAALSAYTGMLGVWVREIACEVDPARASSRPGDSMPASLEAPVRHAASWAGDLNESEAQPSSAAGRSVEPRIGEGTGGEPLYRGRAAELRRQRREDRRHARRRGGEDNSHATTEGHGDGSRDDE